MQWHKQWLHTTLFVDSHLPTAEWQGRSTFKGYQGLKEEGSCSSPWNSEKLVPDALSRQAEWTDDSVANKQYKQTRCHESQSESQSTANRNDDRFEQKNQIDNETTLTPNSDKQIATVVPPWGVGSWLTLMNGLSMVDHRSFSQTCKKKY